MDMKDDNHYPNISLDHENLHKELDIFYEFKNPQIYDNYLKHRTKRLSYHFTIVLVVCYACFTFPIQAMVFAGDIGSGVDSKYFCYRILISTASMICCCATIVCGTVMFQNRYKLLYNRHANVSSETWLSTMKNPHHNYNYFNTTLTSAIFCFSVQLYYILLLVRRCLSLNCFAHSSHLVQLSGGGVCYSEENMEMAFLYNAGVMLIIPVFLFIAISNISVRLVWFNLSFAIGTAVAVGIAVDVLKNMYPQLIIYIIISVTTVADLQYSGILDFAYSREIIRLHQVVDEVKSRSDKLFREEMRILIGNVAHDIKSPLTSFITGIEYIECVLLELTTSFTKSNNAGSSANNGNTTTAAATTSSSNNKVVMDRLRDVSDCLQSLRATYSLALAIINRSSDFYKATRGIPLVARYEDVSIVQVVKDTVKDIQHLVSHQCAVRLVWQINNTQLETLLSRNSVSSSSHWNNKNLLQHIPFVGMSPPFTRRNSQGGLNSTSINTINLYSQQPQPPPQPQQQEEETEKHNLTLDLESGMAGTKQKINVKRMASEDSKSYGMTVHHKYIESIAVTPKASHQGTNSCVSNRKREEMDSKSPEQETGVAEEQGREEEEEGVEDDNAGGEEQWVDEAVLTHWLQCSTDGGWLKENLLCLLSNAVKYSQNATGDGVDHSDLRQVLITVRLVANAPLHIQTKQDVAAQAFTSYSVPLSPASPSAPSAPSLPFSPTSPFSPTPPTTSAPSCYLKFTVTDSSGLLMSDKQLEAFFNFNHQNSLHEPHHKIPSTGVTEGGHHHHNGGTGLGLFSLAKRIEVLGGWYGASTRTSTSFKQEHGMKPGKGTRVWFTVPVYPSTKSKGKLRSFGMNNEDHHTLSSHSFHLERNDSAQPSLVHPVILSPRMLPSSNKPKHVLVVDDSAAIVKMLRLMLQKLGYRVTSGSHGRAGVELFEAHNMKKLNQLKMGNGCDISEEDEDRIDIVLMDIQMPVMNGLEAMATIRQLEQDLHRAAKKHHQHSKHSSKPWRDERVRIIAMSANAEFSTYQDAITAGADAFLNKPFTMDLFQQTLEKISSMKSTSSL